MFSAKLNYKLAIAAFLVAAPLSSLPLVSPFGVQAAQAQQANVSFSVFFDNLASHGRWVRHSQYRYVWCPEVDNTWAPYTHGHWLYLTGRGWYFASDEPFAWAAYHYGRWFRDTSLGWCWVPGNVWAPAWVSWRRSSDYVGWAPLAPEGDGFAVSLTISNRDAPHDDWFFVPTRSFLRPQLSVEIVFGAQHQDVFDRTQFVGPVTVQNNVVVNNVIELNFIEQQTKEKVPQVTAQTVSDPKSVGAAAQGQTIAVFDPKIEPPKTDEAPAQAVDAAQAAKDKGAAAPAAGTTTTGTATDAKAGAQTTTPATPAACLPAEMVNGVCPPDKNKGANKPAADTTAKPADNTPATATPATPATDTAKPAATTTTAPAAPATETAKPAATTPTTPATNAPAKGKDTVKCLPAEMVDGVCPPAGNKHKDAGKPAATDNAPAAAPAATDNAPAPAAGNDKPATTDTTAQPAAPAAVEAPKGKQAKCLPAEMVDGVCPVKGNAK